jgi:hypothetical protein
MDFDTPIMYKYNFPVTSVYFVESLRICLASSESDGT